MNFYSVLAKCEFLSAKKSGVGTLCGTGVQ